MTEAETKAEFNKAYNIDVPLGKSHKYGTRVRVVGGFYEGQTGLVEEAIVVYLHPFNLRSDAYAYRVTLERNGKLTDRILYKDLEVISDND